MSGVDDAHDDVRIERREALKKAAAAAGTAGVVWAAPAVTGLSVAAAAGPNGSIGDAVTISIGSSGNENNVGSGCNPGDHWFAMTAAGLGPNTTYANRGVGSGATTPVNEPLGPANTAVTHVNTPTVTVNSSTTSRGPVPNPTPARPTSFPAEPSLIYTSRNSQIQISAVLNPGVGNINVTPGPGHNDADLGPAHPFTISFSVNQGQYNRCRVTEATLNRCGQGGQPGLYNQYLNSRNPTDAVFTVTENTTSPALTLTNTALAPNNRNKANPGPATFSSNVTTVADTNSRTARMLQIKISCE